MRRKQDFGNSTIYHIRVISTKQVVYVGSTTDFKERCYNHKSSCKNGTSPIYTYIREQGGYELFEIVPVSVLQLTHEIELRMEEQLELEKYTDTLNAQNAYTSKQDRLKQMKDLDEKNKVKLKERRRARYERNLKKESEQSKSRYELNKEKKKEQMKVYSELNKEKLKEKRKAKREQKKSAITA